MKKLLLSAAILLSFNSFAQLNRFQPFIDIGLGSTKEIGGSVTIDYKPIKWMGVGIGFQSFKFDNDFSDNPKTFNAPTLFLDFRAFLPIGKSQIFAFGNIGRVFKTISLHDDTTYPPVIFKSALSGGFGYAYKISKYSGIYSTIDINRIGLDFNNFFGRRTFSDYRSYNIVLSIGYTF